jgi:hypothetical protein
MGTKKSFAVPGIEAFIQSCKTSVTLPARFWQQQAAPFDACVRQFGGVRAFELQYAE